MIFYTCGTAERKISLWLSTNNIKYDWWLSMRPVYDAWQIYNKEDALTFSLLFGEYIKETVK